MEFVITVTAIAAIVYIITGAVSVLAISRYPTRRWLDWFVVFSALVLWPVYLVILSFGHVIQVEDE